MKNMALACMALTFWGCGQKSDIHRKLPLYEGPVANSYVPLKRSDKACNPNALMPEKLAYPLHLFLNGSSGIFVRSFEGYLDRSFIRNPNQEVIKSTVYDLSYEYVFSVGVVRRQPKEFTICPGETEFDANSMESAALNTTYFVNKTYSAVRAVRPALPINPITLNIAPEWKIADDQNQIKYFVDNASYDPNREEIFIFPHSPLFKMLNKKNFWEVPMVASHEYGHHIFSMITDKIRSSSVATTCFTETGITTVSQSKVNGALNEGFADLVAFYSLSKTERSFEGVNCLQRTRQVDAPTFFDENDKVFAGDALEEFFSSNPKVIRFCETTDFSKIHTLGAIFAHSADKFFSRLVTTDKDKLDLAINWLESFDKNQTTLASLAPKAYLKAAVELMMKSAVQKSGATWTPELCSEAQDIYPGASIEGC
jgi:hypothetical protein